MQTTKAVSSGPIKIGFIGDSITYGGHGAGNPVNAEVKLLGDKYIAVNHGISGATSSDWKPDGDLYSRALADFKAQDVHTVSIMLGTNDARNGTATPPETYKENLEKIIDGLLESKVIERIILNTPPYSVPAPSGLWSAASLSRLQSYAVQRASIAHGESVMIGDTEAYSYFQHHQDELIDGVHPTKAGNLELGKLWAAAYAKSYLSVPQKADAAQSTGRQWPSLTTFMRLSSLASF